MNFINYLEKITGVDIYAMISLTIFFTFFIVMGFWAVKADKKLIKELSDMPLNN